MDSAIHYIELIITTIGAVAFTTSTAVLAAAIRYMKNKGITENLREMRIAAVVFALSALYLWTIFVELSR
jgi:hypothetical protein